MTKKNREIFRLSVRAALGFCFAFTSQAQDGSDLAWRNVQSGKYFQIQISESGLQIIPLGSVHLSADLPVRLDKKGRRHIMGTWQNGAAHGFLLIHTVSDGVVAGYALVPQNPASANSCDSRTAAVVANMAGGQQNVINCLRQDLSWRRESNLTVQQASSQEPQQSALGMVSGKGMVSGAEVVSSQAFVPSTSDGASTGNGNEVNSLAGVWSSEVASAVNYKRIDLTLRPDGTYSKTFTARTSGWGGAGTVGAPSLGGTHSGRWTANGMMVHLSGDGNWPPSDHNLAEFRRVQ